MTKKKAMLLPDKKIDKTEIIETALREFEFHPKAELIDYYKLFFQSYYGPGHLIKDPESACSYLLDELNNSTKFDTVLIQDIGNSFCRVNLKTVKDGLISQECLCTAFLKSQQTEPVFKEWKSIWDRIRDVLYSVPELEFLKSNIEHDLFLMSRKSLISHSNIYKENYSPHYRIIHKRHLKLFSKDILNS
jgi:hypothetical protein